MRDCANVRIRDLLPELLHDRLSAAVRVEVRAHVNECEDCRSELELLVRVHALVSVSYPVNAARIAASLPPYRVVSLWRRTAASPQLRVAAAVFLLVGGVVVVRGRGEVEIDVPRPGSAVVPTAAYTSELTVGETLADLTENDLRALLDELPRIEAVTPSEADVVVPALGRDGA